MNHIPVVRPEDARLNVYANSNTDTWLPAHYAETDPIHSTESYED